MKKLRLILLVLLALLLIGVIGFTAWAYTPPAPTERVTAILQERSISAENGWYLYAPPKPSRFGVIFYPGGRVDPRSYSVTAQAMADAGYFVVVPSLPFNLAVFNPNEAKEIIAAHPEIEKWVIGGHSLGGSMAAEYLKNYPDKLVGLFFWGSYSASDLSGLNVPVLSIYASEDDLSTEEDIEASRAKLPASAEFELIAGGNHGQFGDYGLQSGDGKATITVSEQQAQVVTLMVNWLTKIVVLK